MVHFQSQPDTAWGKISEPLHPKIVLDTLKDIAAGSIFMSLAHGGAVPKSHLNYTANECHS